jgi:hypothetical protein
MNSSMLGRQTDVAVLMNADISFRSSGDVRRLYGTIKQLASESHAIALTRHDLNGPRYALTLESQMGLPNMISADAWAFNAPVRVKTDMFYSLGEMNCDKFFAYDLFVSGYSLFNPCLDIIVHHHELDLKDVAYYRNSAKDEAAEKAQDRHWRQTVSAHGGEYFGIVRLRSFDLSNGYRPDPVGWSRAGRFFLCLPYDVHPENITSLLEDVATLAAENSLHVSLLFESEASRDFLVEWASVRSQSNVAIIKVSSLLTVVSKLLSGNSEGMDDVLLVNSPSMFSQEALQFASSFLVVCRNREALGGHATGSVAVDQKFRICGSSEGLYGHVARALMSEERTVVYWHKTRTVRRRSIKWLDQTFRRTN